VSGGVEKAGGSVESEEERVEYVRAAKQANEREGRQSSSTAANYDAPNNYTPLCRCPQLTARACIHYYVYFYFLSISISICPVSPGIALPAVQRAGEARWRYVPAGAATVDCIHQTWSQPSHPVTR
jgi:hypothetical protein